MFQIIKHPITDKIKPLDKQIEENDVDSALPKLSNNFMWIISGGAGSGKSNLLLNLLNISHKQGGLGKYYDKIYFISPTGSLDPKFDELLEELEPDQKFDELNDYNIDCIIKDIRSQEDFKKQHYLLIMDDCLNELPSAISKSRIHQFIISRRHLHCSVIVLTQSYIRVPNLWRRNCNLISFFASNNRKEVQSLIEDINDDPDKMMNLLKFATQEPHSFLTIKMGVLKPIFYKKFDRIV
jgi:hypothetical protein